MKRSYFINAHHSRMTTIAPNPADGKSLKDHGWSYVVEIDGTIVKHLDPDIIRAQIWRNNGHNVTSA